ncbi:NAD(P)/FAD-dependent oxidoreductase [Chitinophaga tropicalis]|uniref:FAD-dependent oxidoreductase n=1 Tax=Chitinophaga tropicalis TaxID=2683588 RepID=A0A7K1U6E0_9BACT|nr:FAD-dependent oxidoreductase [Chitinophaga tropicalis]MVT09928.1 FAD-dependent oxidoreductase [Chitinophaga tropicalis]
MDLHSGYPYSLVRYGLPYNYPRLDKDIRTDVIIMGGGISGALSAYHLAQAGIETVVVDARTIGLGSTGASTSLLQYEIDVPLSRLSEKIGERNAATAYTLSYESVAALQQICKKIKAPYFDRRGSLYLASYKKDLELIKQEYKARKTLGFDVKYWDAEEIADKMGFAAPGGIFSNMAAQTDAYMLTHCLHQYNTRKGVSIYDRTTVTDIIHQKNGVTLKTTAGYNIKAKYLVVATGYEAARYIKEPLIELRSTYAVASEYIPGEEYWYKNCLMWETKDPYLYMRPTKDHRILIGGRDEKFYNPARRDRLINSKAKSLTEDFHKKFPHLTFIPELRWTGVFITTKDGLPFIGEYKAMPRTLFALGFGGNGITFSQIAGMMITDIIKGKNNPFTKLFSFNRKLN